MLSDQFQKIERTSSRNLFLIAAGLVIACQLVAMAMVADGQVKKASLREAQISAQNVALASCFEASTRFDRGNCTRQLQADSSSADTNTTTENGAGFNASQPGSPSGSLMNAAFAAR